MEFAYKQQESHFILTGTFAERAKSRIPMRRLLAIAAGALLVACDPPPATHLEQVKARGELVVATRNAGTTYFEGPEGPMGFEYDLARAFAEQLGVRLRIVVPGSLDRMLDMVARGEVDLAAAGLTVTEARKRRLRFGPPYLQVTQQLIYREGRPRPRGLLDVVGARLEVVAGSSHAERLRALKRTEYPELEWVENPDADSEELLEKVWEGRIDYTIADSNEFALNRRYYPELRVAFDLGEPEPVAWAFPRRRDPSLQEAAAAFFTRIRADGTLAQLEDRHFGHVNGLDYVGTRTYLRHVRTRLPRYRGLYEEAARRTGIDWRLLAAIGYQESHWNPRARSPTGVRGLMMLTLATARQLGIRNRLDPRSSVMGGARYLRQLIDRIPKEVPYPDRVWMALAAYNVGFGHLEDARMLVRLRGGNPDRWIDVRGALPLLSQRKWYRRTKHGYARGREPVRYVENIRAYYDLLVWITERERLRLPESVVETGSLPEAARKEPAGTTDATL